MGSPVRRRQPICLGSAGVLVRCVQQAHPFLLLVRFLYSRNFPRCPVVDITRFLLQVRCPIVVRRPVCRHPYRQHAPVVLHDEEPLLRQRSHGHEGLHRLHRLLAHLAAHPRHQTRALPNSGCYLVHLRHDRRHCSPHLDAGEGRRRRPSPLRDDQDDRCPSTRGCSSGLGDDQVHHGWYRRLGGSLPILL